MPASLSPMLGAMLADRTLAELPLRWNLRNPSRLSFLARSLSAWLQQYRIDMSGVRESRRYGS